ncbi:MAG: hypothetical protein QE487_09990 [Fluviicola sp.]|nr:hypothetical protein [Fluviicola sp.]
MKRKAQPWKRTYPFELFSGFNFPQNAVDVSLKIQLINKKSIGVGVRYGRMKTAPQKMNLLLGNECYLNRSINGLKVGLDFTPFYRVQFSTVAPHNTFAFSDFLYYTIGQLYIRANYVYYFNGKQTNDQCIRPEIGISPYFQLGKKRHEKLIEKGVYRFHYIYLHPSISYGYNLDLNSTNTFTINPHQITIGISISYETFYPINSHWPRGLRKALK